VPVTTAFSKITIEVRCEDPLSFEGDAIILPTLSDGRMCFGVAKRVKQRGGASIERQAIERAPIAVGAAVLSDGGKLGVTHVIHAPLLEQLGMRIGVENIRRSTRAGLLAATHFKLERVVIPGIHYEGLVVPDDEAARAIIDEVRAYRGTPPSEIHLMDENKRMYNAFVTEIGE
jgi:O-acetyl-ADP-ribose deacetylase (regulator of RNase III)